MALYENKSNLPANAISQLFELARVEILRRSGKITDRGNLVKNEDTGEYKSLDAPRMHLCGPIVTKESLEAVYDENDPKTKGDFVKIGNKMRSIVFNTNGEIQSMTAFDTKTGEYVTYTVKTEGELSEGITPTTPKVSSTPVERPTDDSEIMTEEQGRLLIDMLLEICDFPTTKKLTKFPTVNDSIAAGFDEKTVREFLSKLSNETYTGNSSSCRSVCTGLCVGTCGSECTGSCGNACDGCTGGCKDSCYTECLDGCTGGCKDSCVSTCTDGCMGTCIGTCTTSCSIVCSTTCANACKETCSGLCTGCRGTCKSSCTGGHRGNTGGDECGCGGNCASACGFNCKETCRGFCADGCKSGCVGDCKGTCENTCDGTSTSSSSPYNPPSSGCPSCNGCTYGCQGGCGGCDDACLNTCKDGCGGNCQGKCSKDCSGYCKGDCSTACNKAVCGMRCSSGCSHLCAVSAGGPTADHSCNACRATCKGTSSAPNGDYTGYGV